MGQTHVTDSYRSRIRISYRHHPKFKDFDPHQTDLNLQHCLYLNSPKVASIIALGQKTCFNMGTPSGHALNFRSCLVSRMSNNLFKFALRKTEHLLKRVNSQSCFKVLHTNKKTSTSDKFDTFNCIQNVFLYSIMEKLISDWSDNSVIGSF